MTARLRRLLAEPDLGLELVAGSEGVGRRGAIRWAHISEIPDPTPWLEGGELLLTTGLAVKDDAQLQRRLIAGLDAVGCPAVGFGIGIWLDDVPPAMVDEAERRALPLFTVPYEVPFIAVTRYVSRRVFEAHDLGLRRALDLHRRMLAAVTSGGGIDEVLDVTARAIGGVDVVLFDAFGRVLGHRVEGTGIDAARLWGVLPPRPRSRLRFVLGDRIVTAAPVRASDEVEAVLAVVSAGELDDGQMLLIEQAVTAVAVALSRGVSARAQRRATIGALFDDAGTGRAGTNQLADRLAGLALDVDAPFHVLAIVPPPDVPAGAICRVVEDAAADHRVAVGVTGDLVHVVVQPADAPVGAGLLAAARGRGLASLRVGRSHEQHDVGGLAAALRESATAARHADGSAVVDVAALGASGLLAGMGPAASSAAFVTRMLGPLLDHDAEGGPALVATLGAYLDHGCRPGPAAAQLGVHRHTLTYRLDRIAVLTGRDPRDGAHLVSYGMALELLPRGPVSPL